MIELAQPPGPHCTHPSQAAHDRHHTPQHDCGRGVDGWIAGVAGEQWRSVYPTELLKLLRDKTPWAMEMVSAMVASETEKAFVPDPTGAAEPTAGS
ncbi:hypothetical protein ADL30_04510 [Streptomyces sp. NRRL S-1521]|nr:hypothetical protein ADL30_04510 [Streptomyces sp. NRRL S-1521]